MQGDETYAADSLIDVGPAPPLPNKCDFDLGPPAGGQAAYPPQNPGFTYPPPVQPQQPGIYPNAAAGASSAPFQYPGGAVGGASVGQPPVVNNNLEKNLLGKIKDPFKHKFKQIYVKYL